MNDRNVTVKSPHVEKYLEHTPVLFDDIISTARTMMETVRQLKFAGMKPTVVIGVHAIFAGNAFEDLQLAGAEDVATCNTIKHVSNRIDLTQLIASSLRK